MFNTLIVATDLEAGPDRAVGLAEGLARRADLPLEVVYVVAPDRDARVVERRYELSPPSGRDRVTVVPHCEPAAAILDHVRSRDGALLVMTTGATGLLSGLRRSITGEILAGLAQPALLLGPAVPDPVPLAATLVAGLAPSTGPDPALHVIESWRRTFGLTPAWIVDVIATTGWPADTGPPREGDHLRAAVQRLVAGGTDATAAVLHGDDPVASLIAFASGLADPVFVMTSDRWAGGPSHWYSTTRRLVQRSSHPVLVVPGDLLRT